MIHDIPLYLQHLMYPLLHWSVASSVPNYPRFHPLNILSIDTEAWIIMATTLHGKGIFFVNSKISRPDILDVPTFLKWYDDDHIPEIIETSGIRSARRFVDIDAEADMPYLAMYPMEDLGFTQSQEFCNIHVTSDILPGDNSIYDLADINARCDNLISVYDKTTAGKGTIKSLVVITFEMKGIASPEEVEQWFRQKVRRLSLSTGH